MTSPTNETCQIMLTSAVLNSTAYDPPLMREPSVRLHLNENFYGPSNKCCAATLPHDPAEFSMYAEGNKILEDALAAHHGVDVDRVLVTLGAAGALQQIFAAVLSPGRSVLIPKPGWSYYRMLSMTMGGAMRDYPLVAGDGGWSVDYERLTSELEAEPSLVIINTPHMPTGSTVDLQEILQLARACPHSLFVVDQAYYGYADQNELEPDQIEDYENILLVRTFSKLYALASQRVGYITGSAAMLRQIRKLSPLFGIPLTAQRSAAVALEEHEYYAEIAQETRKTRDRFIAAVNSTGEFLAYPSKSNFVLVECLSRSSEHVTEHLRGRGYSIRDCRGYGLAHHVRVTLARPTMMETVAELMLERFNQEPEFGANRSERIG